MKKRLKGLLALITVMTMIVSISPDAFGSIDDGTWGSAPDSQKFIQVVIDPDMTLEERLEEAYESTGWYFLDSDEVDVDYNASIGTSMDNYSEYTPDHYRIDGWKIWECYYSGELCLDDGLKTTLVGADYIVTEEDIKQYGQTDGLMLYQPYIEAKFAPIDYEIPVYDITGTQIQEYLSFNAENYKDKALDIPEGYAGYMMTIQVENKNTSAVFQYESFVNSYEAIFNEFDYYVKGYGASEISITKIVPTKKMPYYVEDINKDESLIKFSRSKIIWLEPGENLVDNKELMTYYPHHMPEGEWEVWFVNGSGKLYEYKAEEVGVTITDAFTADGYSEFMNYPKKYYNSTSPILREKLTPRIYEIPVYDMKSKKTEETFDINIDNYKVWDDNIGEDSTTTSTYDFNNHLTTEGDYWIFEYGDTSVTVENPSQIGNILFAEKTTCDMSKAKLKAICNSHTYDNGTIVKDSTLTQIGTTKYSCTKCGSSYTKDDVAKKIALDSVKITTSTYTYTGYNIKPSITVTASVNGKLTTLKENTDYTVSYSNNKNPGLATVKVTGKGLYSGTLSQNFTIKPKKVAGLKQSKYGVDNITLKWNKVTGANGYEIFLVNAKTGKLKSIKSTTTNTYKVTGLKAGNAYRYAVKAYTIINGNRVYGAAATINTITRPKATNIKVTPQKKKATIKWNKVTGANGYEIYMSTKKKSGYKKITTIKSNKTKYVKNKLTSKKTYYFKIKAYKTNSAKTKIYSASFSKVVSVKIK